MSEDTKKLLQGELLNRHIRGLRFFIFVFFSWSFINGPQPDQSFNFVLFTIKEKYGTNLTINDKSVDGVLGTRTQDGRRR